MKLNEGKLIGILGTVIIHLLAGIIFMSFKLTELKTVIKKVEKFEIEFSQIEENKIPEKAPEPPPPTTVENVLYDDVEMLNIARNLTSRSEVKIDPNDYIDQVKDELIQTGRLGVDNYLDRQGGNAASAEEDHVAVINREEEEKEEEETDNARKMAANYQGPTRIYYDLSGRDHIYLPIPIYKCQGSGKVVLVIEVNQRGRVENAQISQAESNTSDECLIETAISTALVSRFEPDLNAPKTQKGTLTYIFVAQ
ncbi:MAG: hypothetical protein RBT38_00820 [Bacteroidales bacterium]|nr:hypothetical protein [Bacteroidales bacterium]